MIRVTYSYQLVQDFLVSPKKHLSHAFTQHTDRLEWDLDIPPWAHFELSASATVGAPQTLIQEATIHQPFPVAFDSTNKCVLLKRRWVFHQFST